MYVLKEYILKERKALKSEEMMPKYWDEIVPALRLKKEEKEKFLGLIRHLAKIIDDLLVLPASTTDIGCYHIHVGLGEHYKVVEKILARYLAVRFFWEAAESGTLANDKAFEAKEANKRELQLNLRQNYAAVPMGVKGTDFGEWCEEKRKLKEKFKFLDRYKTDFSPNTLMLTLMGNLKDNKDWASDHLFVTVSEEKNTLDSVSHVVASSKSFNSMRKCKSKDERLLFKQLENLVLLNTDGRSAQRTYNLDTMQRINKSSGGRLKRLFVISLSKNITLNSLRKNEDRVKQIFFKNKRNSIHHFIPLFETSCLLGDDFKKLPSVDFEQDGRRDYWLDFRELLEGHEELRLLRSIRMRSIYCLAVNEQVAEAILKAIFDNHDLLDFNTKDYLRNDISDSLKENIKNTLSLYLEALYRSDWPTHIKLRSTSKTKYLVADRVNQSENIANELKEFLGVKKLYSWSKKPENMEDKDLLILSYRDTGYYHQIRYNLFDTGIEAETARAVFPAELFECDFQWSLYWQDKWWYNLMNNSLRRKDSSWTALENRITKLKPSCKADMIDESLEEYESNGSLDTYQLHWNSGSTNQYRGSEKFIYSLDNEVYRVARLDELVDEGDKDFSTFRLKDFYGELNLAAKIRGRWLDEENKRLLTLKEHFRLEDEEDPKALWKILLKRKVDEQGLERVYEEFNQVFEKEGVKLVSKQYFEQVWTDADSDVLIPLNKKGFRALCTLLEIPNAYRRIMRRMYSARSSGTSSANALNDKLFSQLFEDGCYDEQPFERVKSILQQRQNVYARRINFEDIGLEEEDMVGELEAVVELTKNGLKKLRKVETIKYEHD